MLGQPAVSRRGGRETVNSLRNQFLLEQEVNGKAMERLGRSVGESMPVPEVGKDEKDTKSANDSEKLLIISSIFKTPSERKTEPWDRRHLQLAPRLCAPDRRPC